MQTAEQGSAETTGQTTGNQLLDHAIGVMEDHRSIEARIRQKSDLFNQHLIGSGTYLEQWEETSARFDFERMRFRWEMTLLGRPKEEASVIRRVRDSRYVWEYKKIGPAVTLSRLDMVEIAEALEESGRVATAARINAWPELGGLARLLRDLGTLFEFTPPAATTLPGAFPAWKLEGRWRPDQLERLAPETAQAYAAGQFDRVPQQLPTHIEIYLGRRDFFPYRIEYQRAAWNPEDEAYRRRPIVELEFFEVDVDQVIDDSNFRYSPGPNLFDRTTEFIEKLEL